MEQMKHTPGPWEFRREDWMILAPNHEDPSRKWHIAEMRAQGAETHGNAALIAAAPELYEALEVIADWASVRAKLSGEHPGALLDVIDSITDRARSALSKARTP
jgi:hypothetical protein